MADNGDWLRARGIGRERFAGYLADYLKTLGYAVDRSDSADSGETLVTAKLVRMNPSVPASARELSFRLYPTSGGAAAVWVAPVLVPDSERSAISRMTSEMVLHLQRTVATESHATAKVSPPPKTRLPWEPPT